MGRVFDLLDGPATLMHEQRPAAAHPGHGAHCVSFAAFRLPPPDADGGPVGVDEGQGVARRARRRRFAWYFTARTVSTAGSVMVPVALAFAVLHVDPSAGALAQVLGVRTLALVVFLLVGGVVSDRFSRIAVLQVAHVLTCLTQGLAAALIITGHATLTQLTVIEGVNGAVSAFTMPAMMGIVPLVVDRHEAAAGQRAALLQPQQPRHPRTGAGRAARRRRRAGVGARRRRVHLRRRRHLPEPGPPATPGRRSRGVAPLDGPRAA